MSRPLAAVRRPGSLLRDAGQGHQQSAPPQFALELPGRRGPVRLPGSAQMTEQGEPPQHEGQAHQQLEGEVEHVPPESGSSVDAAFTPARPACRSQGLRSRAGV